MGLVPLRHLVGHPHIAGNIALVHDFALQHLRDKAVGKRQEKDHDTGRNAYFLE